MIDFFNLKVVSMVIKILVYISIGVALYILIVKKRTKPVSFGYKHMWLAIRTKNTKKVIEVLGLKNGVPTYWKDGVDEDLFETVFVSPPVVGWTFVIGSLPGINESKLSEVKKTLLDLGEYFIDVQFFVTHRVSEYHSWSRVVKKKFIRGYAFLGESMQVLWDVGKPTEEEVKLEMNFSDITKDTNSDKKLPTEDDVIKLAGAWSIDPTTLENEKSKGKGYLFQTKEE
ncbi:MAG: hypothetical protein ACI8Y7_001102 [Candidatus Woesearchaeota archaeon]|jgi:hypothetical protein